MPWFKRYREARARITARREREQADRRRKMFDALSLPEQEDKDNEPGKEGDDKTQ